VLVATVAVPLYRFRRHYAMQGLLTGWLLILVTLFIVLKTEPLATQLSRWWRLQAGQDLALASIVDLRWLGFSYVAFRLIHTVRDRQLGILPAFSLRDYVTYVIFFPAYVAGPIDRAEHFIPALQRLPELAGFAAARWSEGLARIAIGVGKKFVVADSLGYFSLDPARAAAATSPAGLWLLLYAFSLRLYLDFSGYTDIAIGLGLLFGVRLPENFRWPYLQTDLNRFWHTWHITLGDWVRFYVFSPLSRALLRRQPRPSPVLVMLFAQLVTMITIGLWHGITLAFFVWGLWHGIGLFIHKQWSRYSRPWQQRLQPRGRKVWTGISWFITFQYVTLGWVWFALPDAGQAVRTFGRLAGLGW
jgi:alginate O-acetyltransferase complex protein AlgI